MNFFDLLAQSVLLTRSDAIIAADREGIIRFWNPGAERIFGHVRDDAIGHSLDLIIPERDLFCQNARRWFVVLVKTTHEETDCSSLF